MDSTQAWQCYADNVVKLAIGNIDNQFQWFCSAGLTTPYALINSQNEIINDAVYQLGNSIPALSNSYIPYSDLFTSYQLFLNMLTPAMLGIKGSNTLLLSSTAQQMQQDIAKQLSALTRDTSSFSVDPVNFVRKRAAVFKKIRVQERALMGEFKANNQQQYANIITDARNKVWLASNMMQVNGLNMTSTTTPGLYFPRFEMPNFVEQFTRWQTDVVNPVVIEISQSTVNKQKGLENKCAQGIATAINRNLSPNVNLSDPIVAHSSSIEVGFQRLGSFDINPGRWFNLSLIRLQRKANPNGMKLFFGENGTLGLLPTQIVLGFRPWVRYRMTDAMYRANKSTFQKLIAGSKDSRYQFKDVEATIEYGPTNTNLPTLVGVLSTRIN